MRGPAGLLSILIAISPSLVHAQETHLGNLKTIVVSTKLNSDSVITVSPATSFSMDLRGKKVAVSDTVDLREWLRNQVALNGLQSTDLRPWHIVVSYDQFDEDGDNVHSGVFEEFWAGEKKYKRIYKSDNLNQTDYATDKGLYRQGDQRWPAPAQLQVRSEVLAPFSYAETLQGFHARNVERTFNDYKLQCVLIEKDTGISDPAQYCFEPNGSILRYNRGFGWFQTVYNQIISFQGRNLAKEVDVTDGGKPYLKLRVETIDLLSGVDDRAFVPPAGAMGPLGDRVSGVMSWPINMSAMPKWPASLRAQHFTVVVEIVIGKDGHVVGAHAISGPPEAYKASEDAVRKWVFKPYLVLDKPVEVEQKVEVSNN